MLSTTIKDPLLRQAEAPLRGVFHPLGFRLEVETNDARVLAAAETSYGLFSADHESAPVRLRVIVTPAQSEAVAAPASYRGYRDTMTIVCDAENFLICDLEKREAFGFVTGTLLDDGEAFREAFLDAFTYMALQRHWLTPLHAACVVREGIGICLAGPSEAGKSTLSYACLKAGYQLISDNSVTVLNSDIARGYRGNPSRLRLRPSARDLFPELLDVPLSDSKSGKPFLAIQAREMFPQQMVTRALLGPIVFLNRHPCDAPALDKISCEEAFDLLCEDRPVNDDLRVFHAAERAIREVVQSGGYRLHYETCQQALEALAQLPLPLPQRTPA